MFALSSTPSAAVLSAKCTYLSFQCFPACSKWRPVAVIGCIFALLISISSVLRSSSSCPTALVLNPLVATHPCLSVFMHQPSDLATSRQLVFLATILPSSRFLLLPKLKMPLVFPNKPPFRFSLPCSALQGQVKLSGHLCDEHVARREAEGHRGLGRGRPPFGGLAPLRGTRRRHHHLRQVGTNTFKVADN